MILLSWDGMRHDYPQRVEAPALARMARDGARATRLTPVFPANTFPNHVALVTGTYPDRHGVVGNEFIDRERGRYKYSPDASWIDAEPLWIAAERQGVRAATFFWVGSETDWHGKHASLRRAPFEEKTPESEKVDQILAWLDLPEAERPRLILSYWHGCDGVGHALGPDAPEIAKQLSGQDAELGRLLAGLDARKAWDSTSLLVVSDHGMSAVSERLDAEALLRKAGIAAQVVPGGGMAYVYLEKPAERERAIEVLETLDRVQVFPSDAMPRELRLSRSGRSGDILLVTEPPRVFGEPAPDAPRGMHGYLPGHPEMGAIFYALGRGVPRGRSLGEVRTVDVAATVTRLLGIEPPLQSEGTPVPGFTSGQ